jgi:hypothetical protein
MPRVDPDELSVHVHYALAGEPGPLRSFLGEHSNLPGARGNLEVAGRFADLVARLATGGNAAAAWEVVTGLAAVGPNEGPTGDPGEFLAFCGTVAVGEFAPDPARHRGVWRVVGRAAEDPRWRLREAAAQAIQRALPLDPAGTLAILEEWASGGDWMLCRAVVAGMADPPLLATSALAAAALRLHEIVLGRLVGADDRRNPGFRVLRQGLGYSLSVAVAALPGPGFALMRRLAALSDRDLAWVLRSNLGKARLARAHAADVAEIRRLLGG